MAESTFTKMNNVMKENDIPWTNCVGTAVDNTSVNNSLIMTICATMESKCVFHGLPFTIFCKLLQSRQQKVSLR